MKIIIYTLNEKIVIEPAIIIDMKSIIEQLEEGNLVLIEEKNGNTIIVNCINISAIEII